MTLKGVFGQSFCLKMPFSYGIDELFNDLQVGSSMEFCTSCPLEIIFFRRSGLVFVNDVDEGLVAGDDGVFTLDFGVSVLFVSIALHF